MENAKEKQGYDWKSTIAGLIILIVGIGLILLDLFVLKTDRNLWINIGCSLIASSIVIIATAVFIERRSVNPIANWGLEKIYRTRAEKNVDSHERLPYVKKQIDVVAFGLKAFRNSQSSVVTKLVNKGVRIRILTMNPESPFVKQREKEEDEADGQIKNTIEQLIDWAKRINEKNPKGWIEIKGYNCMTLDFYWRMDDELYVGPYWYGRGSQQTITYRFEEGKEGFQLYEEYFESLWKSEDMIQLVSSPKEGKKRNKT